MLVSMKEILDHANEHNYAVIAPNACYEMELRAYLEAAEEMGIRIPEDISAVGYDGIPLSRVMSPVLTTWRQDTTGLGRTAAEKLIGLIERPKTAIFDRVVVKGSLQEGGTVAPIASV